MAGPTGSGFHPHLPGFKHKFLAKALGASMWFFIFYRARGWSEAFGSETSMGGAWAWAPRRSITSLISNCTLVVASWASAMEISLIESLT
ncbi:hypothetical protein V8E53_008187 [Lactarius tabidus]